MQFHKFLLFFVSIALTGCDSETVWRSGNYEISWIDTPDLHLDYRLDGDTSIGRVDEPIYAVGENAKFIVVECHPKLPLEKDYYYIIKSEDAPRDAHEAVRGPFSEEQFKKIKVVEGLPDFSQRFYY